MIKIRTGLRRGAVRRAAAAGGWKAPLAVSSALRRYDRNAEDAYIMHTYAEAWQ